MRWINQFLLRKRLYGELSEEIREHLEEKIEELVAGGCREKRRAMLLAASLGT